MIFCWVDAYFPWVKRGLWKILRSKRGPWNFFALKVFASSPPYKCLWTVPELKENFVKDLYLLQKGFNGTFGIRSYSFQFPHTSTKNKVHLFTGWYNSLLYIMLIWYVGILFTKIYYIYNFFNQFNLIYKNIFNFFFF